MKPFFRSIRWGIGLSLTLALLEVFGILAHLKVTGGLEGKYITNVFWSFGLYGPMGIGLGVVCGLVWVMLSRTAWHRRLEPWRALAWERGTLLTLLIFAYMSVIVHARIFTNIPFLHPLSLFVSLVLLLISAGLAFIIESAVLILNRKKRVKTVLTGSLATLLALACGSVLFWQHAFNFNNFVSDTVSAATLEGDSSSNRPNIFLITIDALRADHLSSYGYTKIHTENIDRLAKDDVLFEQMVAQAPWTRASFGSIWTSSYPSQHQAISRTFTPGRPVSFDQVLTDGLPTIAEFFSNAGYVTIGLNTNPVIGAFYGFDRGFQLFIDNPALNVGKRSILFNVLKKLSPYSDPLLKTLGYRYLPAERVYQIYQQIVKRLRRERKPFFLWTHLMDPHGPYYFHESPSTNGDVYTSISPSPQGIEKLLRNLEGLPAVKEILIKTYDSEILYADHYVGKMVNQLRRSKLLDGTLVVLVSDHGEEFFDHGKNPVANGPPNDVFYQRGHNHGHTMYDELLRVPLIMKFPNNQFAGQRVTSIVQHIDLLPTLLAFAGIPVDLSQNGFEGTNVLNNLRGNQPLPTRYAISESIYYGREIKEIRSIDHKLIYHTIDQSIEFYNLSSDPLEKNNIVDAGEESPHRMLSALRSWMVRMGREDQRYDKKNIEWRHKKQLIEQLKALGYVQ
jgi:arylsulfatase A-like enzyme